TDRPQSNLEKTLLAWCRKCTHGYQRVNVTNFTTSFRDGLAFNAIFHYHKPDAFNYMPLLSQDHVSNLNHAFNFAERYFGIEAILDADDISVDQPDKKSILIYV
ncbi:hypothetical protein HELRODRAFT_137415, partial [Helobdella robusta]|uniref:Calponin-homology (CH) domain-containing protein n=1 Tax=Helobdella robusta TaxID=6412 RepID=T1EIK6_HELRO